MVMRMPEGQEIPCPGTYLEIVPNRKLVFSALARAARDAMTTPPAGEPRPAAIARLDDEGGYCVSEMWF